MVEFDFKFVPCYKPIRAWIRSRSDGKHSVSFSPQKGWEAAGVPCQKCIGCRLRKAQDWSNRIQHEKQSHDLSVFLTLTYDNQHLPADGLLDHEHFKAFMKRLRRTMEYDHYKATGNKDYPKIKYFMCGEYGDTTRRAHYHAIILGVDFPDKKFHSKTKSGHDQYTSKKLDALWGMGFVTIGSVTHESAGYTARYVMKKQYEEAQHEKVLAKIKIKDGCSDTQLPPKKALPYMVCSKGFGRAFYEEYGEQIHNRDSVINAKGRENPVPVFYDKILLERDPLKMAHIKKVRKEKALNSYKDNTLERLEVRGKVKARQIESLKRDAV